MTSTGSRQKNDCVIVAIVNATGMDYDVVKSELEKLTPKELIGRSGIRAFVWHKYLESLGWKRRQTIPRRGQEKLGTCIVRFISQKTVAGHLAYLKGGIVYDSCVPSGLPLKEYQRRSKKGHINEIWIEVPKISVLNDNWDDLSSWMAENLVD